MKKKDSYTFVAVAYGGEASIPHFEQAKTFWAYYLDGGRIRKRELLSLYAADTDEMIRTFTESLFDVVICRNFGPKAMAKLKAAGLRLYSFDGGCDRAVRAYLAGELSAL